MTQKAKDPSDRLFMILGVVAAAASFAYACFCAYHLPFEHDEAVSFNFYVWADCSYWDVVTYGKFAAANNHLLNTLIMKLAYPVFGTQELALRASALLGHLLYITGIFGLLRLFAKKHIFFLCYCLCLSHPFLLKYFSIARGYGLGLGFLAWGLFFLFKRVEEPGFTSTHKTLHSFLACLMMALSVLANLSFVVPFLVVICMLIVLEIKNIWDQKHRSTSALSLWAGLIKNGLAPVLLSTGVLLLIYIGPVLKLKAVNEFYFGGRHGFWADTVTSLIQTSIFRPLDYHPLPAAMIVYSLMVAVILLLVLGVWTTVISLFGKKPFGKMDRFLLMMTALLFLCAGAISAQHILFHVRLMMERTAIYFIPAFLLFISLLWQKAEQSFGGIRKRITGGFFCLLVLCSTGYFVSCLGPVQYVARRHDADLRSMVRDLDRIGKNGIFPRRPIRMGARWVDEPVINFYLIKYNLRWANLVNRTDKFDGHYDCYFLFKNDFEMIRKYHLSVVARYPVSEGALAFSLPNLGIKSVPNQ